MGVCTPLHAMGSFLATCRLLAMSCTQRATVSPLWPRYVFPKIIASLVINRPLPNPQQPRTIENATRFMQHTDLPSPAQVNR